MNRTAALIETTRNDILAEAAATAGRTPHYGAAGEVETTARLDVLFDTLVDAVERRDLTDVLRYARRLAAARFAAGYDLAEVQVAINALEEAVWRRIFAAATPDELGESLRLVSTVLGAAKDVLAQTYVSLASDRPEVDVAALFAGTN
jgi:hypothetical protein